MTEMANAMRIQLAQLLGMGPAGPQVDLNPELRAQLLAELAELERGAAGGGVPGGFPGEEDEEDEYTDEEFEEGEEAEAEQQRANTFMGRLGALFGGGGAAAGGDPAPQQ